LVPEGNFYRRLQERIDLSFVREMVQDLYAPSGRPSVDPVVFFKLELILFFEDLRSERQLMEVVADRLSLRWYVGYNLHEPLPDQSTLTRIRERYGLGIFRRFFDRIVEECFDAGLVRGEELFFDSTTIKADAARGSLIPRLEVVRHVEELFEDESSAKEQDPASEPPRADAALPTAGDPGLKAANASREDFVSSAGRSGAPPRVANPRPKRRDEIVSRTDPDARLAGHVKAAAKMGYKAHYVVDGGKARVIVNALVTRADLQDNQPMLDLLWRTCFRWKLRPHHVTGDSVYGTLPNVKAIERAGIRAFMPIIDYTRGKRLFNKEEFAYDPERDVYVCPAGEVLKKDGIRFKQQITRYLADPETCGACALKARCTDGKSGRAVARSFDEEFYDHVRSYRGTFAYEKALRKRKVWIEPLFAEAKEWHGMREVRLRMLEKVNCEVLVTATGQNVKRLLEFGTRGPWQVALAAALRPTERSHLLRTARHHRAALPSVFQQAASNHAFPTFLFVVWVHSLNGARGGRGWLSCVCRSMAREESPLGPTGPPDR
ncbi:MAG: IS1182 family transposase, partial [Actinomycetota bacterium]|nr:IS1182 family transposase [Actinomycetota bacterium]